MLTAKIKTGAVSHQNGATTNGGVMKLRNEGFNFTVVLHAFISDENMKSAFMGALADNNFNRILDNDLSESENVEFLIIQHF